MLLYFRDCLRICVHCRVTKFLFRAAGMAGSAFFEHARVIVCTSPFRVSGMSGSAAFCHSCMRMVCLRGKKSKFAVRPFWEFFVQESPPSVPGILGKSGCASRGDRRNLSYSFGVESNLPSAAIASETTWTKQASAFAFHHAQPGVQRGGFLLFVTSPAPAQSMGQNLLSGFIAFTSFPVIRKAAHSQRHGPAGWNSRFRSALYSLPLAFHRGERRRAAAGQLFIYALKARVDKLILHVRIRPRRKAECRSGRGIESTVFAGVFLRGDFPGVALFCKAHGEPPFRAEMCVGVICLHVPLSFPNSAADIRGAAPLLLRS